MSDVYALFFYGQIEKTHKNRHMGSIDTQHFLHECFILKAFWQLKGHNTSLCWLLKCSRAVTIPDFHHTIVLAKRLQKNYIIAISTELKRKILSVKFIFDFVHW